MNYGFCVRIQFAKDPKRKPMVMSSIVWPDIRCDENLMTVVVTADKLQNDCYLREAIHIPMSLAPIAEVTRTAEEEDPVEILMHPGETVVDFNLREDKRKEDT